MVSRGGYDTSRHCSLTPRQWDVLSLMAKGYRNQEIANELSLNLESVENYVNVIYRHIGLPTAKTEAGANRVKAILWYQEQYGITH